MTLRPAEAWAEMLAGNERFIAGTPEHPHQDAARREDVANGQAPIAALFGCSDSRLAAEIIFDRGLGDLFVVRNAGQVVSDSVLGTLEYAVAILEIPLIVVLGHDSCGAVAASLAATRPDAEPLPSHIGGIVRRVWPAVHRVHQEHPELPLHEADPAAVGREHLRDTIADLLRESRVISEAVEAGTLAVVGANYRLAAGRVEPDAVVGQV